MYTQYIPVSILVPVSDLVMSLIRIKFRVKSLGLGLGYQFS